MTRKHKTGELVVPGADAQQEGLEGAPTAHAQTPALGDPTASTWPSIEPWHSCPAGAAGDPSPPRAAPKAGCVIPRGRYTHWAWACLPGLGKLVLSREGTKAQWLQWTVRAREWPPGPQSPSTTRPWGSLLSMELLRAPSTQTVAVGRLGASAASHEAAGSTRRGGKQFRHA